MRRRNFVRNLLAAGALPKLIPGTALAAQATEAPAPDPAVKRVLVMFKCHLDVGFVDTQANIIKKYFEVYFPRAIETAAAIRREGNDRYIWTTGSWLIYQYLERPMARRQQMEQAIAAGDLAWHALPFTWQTELMDRSLISGALGLSRSLDQRFGRTTTGAKMTDVPGHTRALIGPLADHGVKFLDIGVNSASTPPDVAPVFLWKDAAGNSLVMMYHWTTCRKQASGRPNSQLSTSSNRPRAFSARSARRTKGRATGRNVRNPKSTKAGRRKAPTGAKVF
jgi:hypothetical protein